ncbi:UDP-N-acetylmuramoyl-tripeptide--D-alanyl-D-alanine ligase [Clostridium sartagoforme]|uniref:UDP-N-acetylmuramoyl-tripeptide--D-alanyl-D-alanine ligase n=1 Tax=Clostridium sartagoforme TaxID=84031 RepID=A0A4S2DPN4_9CLOT|nr:MULTISPECIES: UDP-N-acetylmuramoyl-tripeptide--D-alanyl-D-alanine ligase [Clostridium]MBS5938914.1 UDP-N-acetylmuramoyl-tripeptide--D-alanyl-D-alanine ligase [Clostridium sp.]TGY44376.1 UDP-N-acetylmuramoyl-tripeptide--D-alanyl-D-alanine ligase [Clostridium sartagoforme]
MELSFKEIVEAINGKVVVRGREDFNNVCIDTRKIQKDNIYIAIKGERFDGNKFVIDAFKKGASIAIVSEILFDIENEDEVETVILVDDTEKALLDLASFYRKKLGLKVVGVTGSCGKTSTKDLIAAFLSEKYKVFKTKGNFNNQIGLPLMILELDSTYDVAVLEMGMSDLGEIDILARCARPDIAVITNIGLSHIENLKTQDNILKAKSEIFNYFDESNTLIINGEDKNLLKIKDKCFEILRIGYNHEYDVYAFNIILMEDNTTFSIQDNNQEIIFNIPMAGKHNILNSMLAIAVAKKLNLSFEEMKLGIKNLEATSMRLEVIKKDKITIINDCYNASPDSMKSSMDVLTTYKKGRKVAILGTMNELGDEAINAHTEVGNYAKDKVDLLIAIGSYKECFRKGYSLDSILTFEDKKDFIDDLKTIIKENDVILVKASRGMKFEEIVNSLEEADV